VIGGRSWLGSRSPRRVSRCRGGVTVTGVTLGSQKWKHHGRPLPPNFGDKSVRTHAEV